MKIQFLRILQIFFSYRPKDTYFDMRRIITETERTVMTYFFFN